VRRRIEAKQRTAAGVLAARLSLAEAIDRYRALNRDRPRPPHLQGVPANVSEDERLCREVIAYVQDALEARPGESDAVLARLEAELQDDLARRALKPARTAGPADRREPGCR
jgi:hypothetical protein